MMAGGDILQQKNTLFQHQDSKTKKIQHRDVIVVVKSSSNDSVDITRLRNMGIVGLLQGPFNHYFYTTLDRYLPGKNAMSLMKKTILDQTIASPSCLGIFFVGLGLLERRNLQEIQGEVRLKLFDVWKVS